jgi:hypothetical protein
MDDVLLGFGVVVSIDSETMTFDEGLDDERHPEAMKKNVRLINNDTPFCPIWIFILFPQRLST